MRKEDKIVSALIGLVGACNNNPKTANTDGVLIKALAFPIVCGEAGDEEMSAMTDEIHAEKNAVAPNCASCAFPCGNTSDYDMERIYGAEEEIRDMKLELLSRCEELAACLYRGRTAETAARFDYEFFYRALSYISFDIGKEPLLELLAEAEERMKRMGEMEHDTENHKD
ncbi:MAG: hypothetical protein NC337_00855 [Roseburia sp.]|nr:hypothetical protein [Roseburia sp.]